MSDFHFGKKSRKTLVICLSIFVVCLGIKMLHNDNYAVLAGSRDIKEERQLIPGGQSVGIQMKVKGALIVGVENNVGPMIGDMIVAVNRQSVNSADDVKRIVEDSKESVEITVVREGKKINYTINPYFDPESENYKLGLWIKEKIAGIGTLSFYDPLTNSFAALGHGIYENETGVLLGSKDGNILNTRVERVKAGKTGTPGELGGTIYNFSHPLGSIHKNTEFGIYGKAEPETLNKGKPISVGTKEEITKGKAYILTTISGIDVEKYEIKITKVHHQDSPDSKGIEFKVTDKKLLKCCGGIVQGMSGSPIIQDGKLVGAVTHVLVNDPTKGYGIFIENMLDAAA